MRAAVVSDFARPPVYTDFREPEAGSDTRIVAVEAAAVHRVVRSIAAGAHYSADGILPLIPGVDGIARLEDGTRIYTGGPDEPFGMLSERTAVPTRFAFPVPDGLESITAAAIVNPAMSSWAPLAKRLQPGATVLVVGATGIAGGLAVSIAKLLGAGRVVAAGRNEEALAALEPVADAVVRIGGDDEAAQLADAAAGFDLVLDYVWGPVAERLLAVIARRARSTGRAVEWVQIGALAGADIALPSALLRQAPLTVSGSGLGSIDPALLGRVIPAILDAADRGRSRSKPRATRSRRWNRPGTARADSSSSPDPPPSHSSAAE